MGTVRRDITGQRFGRLVALDRVEGKMWRCKCDCGNIKIVNRDHLGKDSNSCGCLKKEVSAKRMTKHGENKTRLHNLWLSMRERCNNPNGSEHSVYHDKGIRICSEWEDYLVFKKWALENGYDENAPRGVCTIDRIDNDKGYSPDNCRFVTQKENSRNCSRTRKVFFRGKTIPVPTLAEENGKSACLVRERLNRGWSIEDALTKNVRILKGVNDGSRINVI